MKTIINLISKLVESILLVSIISSLAIIVPEYKHYYIRNKVAQEIVKIIGLNGFATGFNIQTPSGRTFILTNKHVCDRLGILHMLMVRDSKNQVFLRKIIKISKSTTDLCLVKGLPGHSGLKMGSKPHIGDKASIVGHPHGLPTTLQEGEIVGTDNIPFDPPIFSYLSNIITYLGNSGSPVINFWGNVIGVVYAINPADNKGFLITWSDIKKFIKGY